MDLSTKIVSLHFIINYQYAHFLRHKKSFKSQLKSKQKTKSKNYWFCAYHGSFTPRTSCPYYQQSLAENDLTVLSIFVNPTQFNNADDLKKYPRTLEKDVEFSTKELSPKIIFIYAPTVEDIYEGQYHFNLF